MRHRFTSAKSDSPDTTLVRPVDWNNLHDYTITAVASSDVTLDATHDAVLMTTGAVNRTITLPTAVGITGRVYTVKKVDSGAGTATLDANGTETIDGSLTYVLVNQYQYVVVVSDGANWVIVANN